MTWLQRLKAARGTVIHSRRTDETDKTPRFVSFVSDPHADIPSSDEPDPKACPSDGGLPCEEAEWWAAAELPRQYADASAAAKLEAWGDMRPCTWCRNLTRGGRCLAACRGELRQARDWQPTFPNQPMRCIGYLPPDDDPDQRAGRERWRDLVEAQGRRRYL